MILPYFEVGLAASFATLVLLRNLYLYFSTMFIKETGGKELDDEQLLKDEDGSDTSCESSGHPLILCYLPCLLGMNLTFMLSFKTFMLTAISLSCKVINKKVLIEPIILFVCFHSSFSLYKLTNLELRFFQINFCS